MRKSTSDFLRVVIPALQAHCSEFARSQVYPVEGHGDRLTTDLDTLAGIDAYQRWPSALRGIASRIQWGYNWRTFSIRIARPGGMETEYQKRLAVLKRREDGYLYPHLTVQAYLDAPGGSLLSVGVAKTAELYLWVEQERHRHPLPRRQARGGGEVFLCVAWDRYRRSGNYLFEYAPLSLYEEEEEYLCDDAGQLAEEIFLQRRIDDLLQMVEEREGSR